MPRAKPVPARHAAVAAAPADDGDIVVVDSSASDDDDEVLAAAPAPATMRPRRLGAGAAADAPASLRLLAVPAPDAAQRTIHLCRLQLRVGVLLDVPETSAHDDATHGPARRHELDAAVARAGGDDATTSVLLCAPAAAPVGSLWAPHVYLTRVGGHIAHALFADVLPLPPGRACSELASAVMQLALAGCLRMRLVTAGAPTGSSLDEALLELHVPAGACPVFSAARPCVVAPATRGSPHHFATLLSCSSVLSAPIPRRRRLGARLRGGAASGAAASTIVSEPLIPSLPLTPQLDGDSHGASASSARGSASHRHTPVSEQDVYAAARPLPTDEAAAYRKLEEDDEQDDGRALAPSSPGLVRMRAALRSTLVAFQSRAVRWMREREAAGDARALEGATRDGADGGAAGTDAAPCRSTASVSAEGVLYSTVSLDEEPRDDDGDGAASELAGPPETSATALLHPLWAQCRDVDGRIFYACAFSGQLSVQPVPPQSMDDVARPPIITGTLFADEMGLGKTVSVLALVLATESARARRLARQLGYTTRECDSDARLAAMRDVRSGRSRLEALTGERSTSVVPAVDASITAASGAAAAQIDAQPSRSANSGGVDSDFDEEEDDDVSTALAPSSSAPAPSPVLKAPLAASSSSVSSTTSTAAPLLLQSVKGDLSAAYVPRSAATIGAKGSGGAASTPHAVGAAKPADPSNTTCICGAQYLVPLDPSVQAALHAGFDALMVGRTAVPIRQTPRDSLTWVQCGVCARWQHALCAAYDDAAAARGALFFCIECRCASLAGRPLESAATLIVTTTITNTQWQSEIAKHTRTDSPHALRVVVYEGVQATLAALAKRAEAVSAHLDALRALERAQPRGRPSVAPRGSDRSGSLAATSGAQRAPPSTVSGVPASDEQLAALVADSGSAAAPQLHASGLRLRLRVTRTDSGTLHATLVAKPESPVGDACDVEDDTGASPTQSGVVADCAAGQSTPNDSVLAPEPDDASSSASAAAAGGRPSRAAALAIKSYAEMEGLDDVSDDDDRGGDDGGSCYVVSDDDDGGGGAPPPPRAGKRKRRSRGAAATAAAGRLGKRSPAASAYAPRGAASREAAADTVAARLAAIATLTGEAHQLARALQPTTLADADIVITTYDALQADLDYADNQTADFLAYSLTVTPSLGPDGGDDGASSPAARAASNARVAWQLLQHYVPRKLSLFEPSSRAAAGGSGSGSGGAPLSGARSMRRGHQKKYRVVPTPLLAVAFYRAALDETQLIASATRDAAVMARRLYTWHRLCVSGTPLKRSVEDLRGLLLFLGCAPCYEDERVFRRLLLEPAQAGDTRARAALLRLVHALMWRSRLDAVRGELHVPALAEETITLRLPRIQEAFYRREFGRLAERVAPVLAAWRREERDAARAADVRGKAGRAKRTATAAAPSSSSSSAAATPAEAAGSGHQLLPPAESWLLGGLPVTRQEADRVLGPLLRLRMAVVHPQIGVAVPGAGRGGRRAGGAGGGAGRPIGGRGALLTASSAFSQQQLGQVKSMAQVLEEMLNKARVDCEDAQRSISFSLNGLAGLHWLQGDTAAAAGCYRAVIDAAAAADRAVPIAPPRAPVALDRGLLLVSPVTGAPVVRVDRMQTIHALRGLLALTESVASAAASGDPAAPLPFAPPSEAERAAMTIRAAAMEDNCVGVAATAVIGSFSAACEGPALRHVLAHARLRLRAAAPPPEAAVAAAGQAEDSTASFRVGLALPPQRLLAAFRALAATSTPLVAVLRVCAARALDALQAAPGGAARTKGVGAVLDAAHGTGVMAADEREAMQAAAALAGTASVGRAVAWAAGSVVTVKAKLLAALDQLLDARQRAHTALLAALQPTPADVVANANCKLCRSNFKRKGDACLPCRVDAALRHYQAHLLGFRAIHATGQQLPAQSAKRKKRPLAGGLDGDLDSFMQRGEGAGALGGGGAGDEDDGAGDDDDAAAGIGKAGIGHDKSVPTALVRVLTAVARLSYFGDADGGEVDGDSEMDVAELVAAVLGHAPTAGSGGRGASGGGSGAKSTAPAAGAAATSVEAAYEALSVAPSSAVSVQFDDARDSNSSDGSDDDEGAGGGRPPASTAVIRPREWIPRTLELLSAECRGLLELLQRQAGLLSAIDELRMARDVRAELARDDEEVPDAEAGYRVKAFELPGRVAELSATRAEGDADLRKHTAYLRYLLHIKREEDGGGGAGGGGGGSFGAAVSNDAAAAAHPPTSSGGAVAADASAAAPATARPGELCPICRGELLGPDSGGRFYVISPCMHRFCQGDGCLRALLAASAKRDSDFGRRPAACPTCRRAFDARDVVLVAGAAPAAGASSLSSPAAAASTVSAVAAPAADAAAAASISQPPMLLEQPSDSLAASDPALRAHRPVDVDAPPLLANGCRRFFDGHLRGRALAAALGLAPHAGDAAAAAVEGGLAQDAEDAHANASAHLSVAGSFGVKIEALVRCLKALRLQDAAAARRAQASMLPGSDGAAAAAAAPPRPTQALVFSQWEGALSIVEAALARNGIPSLRLSSAKKAPALVTRFMQDPTITALLLPMRPGYAEGLNLTVASRVFCLEPVMEPALRRQALGRIQRMGQTLPTVATDFVVAGTIEETVAALASRRQQLAVPASPARPSPAAAAAAAAHGLRATGTARARSASPRPAHPLSEDEGDDDVMALPTNDGGAPRGGHSSGVLIAAASRRVASHAYLATLAEAQLAGSSAPAHTADEGVDGHADAGVNDGDGGADDGVGEGAGARASSLFAYSAPPSLGSDTGGLLRRDVVRLFASEQAFAQSLEEALARATSASSQQQQQRQPTGAPAPDGRALAASEAAAVAAGGDSASDAPSAAAAASGSAGATVAAAAHLASAANALRAAVARDNRFWAGRVLQGHPRAAAVIDSGSGSGSGSGSSGSCAPMRAVVRLAALAALTASVALGGGSSGGSSVAAAASGGGSSPAGSDSPSAATVAVFGRHVRPAVAAALLALPAADDVGGAGGAAASAGAATAAESAVAADVQRELARLRALLLVGGGGP